MKTSTIETYVKEVENILLKKKTQKSSCKLWREAALILKHSCTVYKYVYDTVKFTAVNLYVCRQLCSLSYYKILSVQCLS